MHYTSDGAEPDADSPWFASARTFRVFDGKTNAGVVLDTLEVYDPAAGSWTNAVAQMPRPRTAFAAVVHQGLIYLVGGEDEQGAPIAAVDVYDPQADSWSEAAPMPTPRSFVSAGVSRNVGRVTGGPEGIVVAGGRKATGEPTTTVEELVIDRGVWRSRAPLPEPRHAAASASLIAPGQVDSEQMQLWLVGGQTAAGLSAAATYYTRSLDYLSHLAELPEGRFMHAAVPIDSRIALFGGRNYSEVVGGWIFDPADGSYRAMADLPAAQNGLAAVALGGRVWAIGGADTFGNAHDCAQKVCTYFGYGEVVAYQTTNNCPGHFLPCAMWYSDGSGIQDWDFNGCVLPAVYYVECYEFAH